MATPKVIQNCVVSRCGHPRDAHDGYGCTERILTVRDTEANCRCSGYVSVEYLSVCVPCGHAASEHRSDYEYRGTICTICGPFNCFGLVTQADIDKADAEYKACSRCGDDPNYCVCTTGWDSARGMIW